jgi:cystathionine beta-lyase/cystathionine gamma-synthase
MRALVVGVGDWERGDEAAPLEVARRVAETAPHGVTAIGWEGSPLELVDRWAGYDRVVVVYAGEADPEVGDLQVGALRTVAPASRGEALVPAPIHADLARALALATGPERVPPPLELVAIGVGRAATDEPAGPPDGAASLSPAVARAVRQLSERIRTALAAGLALTLDAMPSVAVASEATSAAWAGVRPVDGAIGNLEDAVRRWEHADACAAFVTGEAAVRAVLQATHGGAPRVVAVLDPHSIALRTLAAHGADLRRVAADDAAALEAAIDDGVDQLWITSPVGPNLRVLDVARLAHRASGEGAVVVFDATGATAVPPHPIRVGADLVVHADVAALAGTGAVGQPAAGDLELRGGLVAGDAELVARTKDERARTDARMRTATADRLLAGFRSHPLRAERRATNALALARFLKRHPRVRDVAYPGLPGHPDAGRVPECGPARWGPTLACTVDLPEGADAVLARLRWVRCAAPDALSDGVVTLCSAVGEGEGGGVRLRLTCGIEDADDLLDDLDAALGIA